METTTNPEVQVGDRVVALQVNGVEAAVGRTGTVTQLVNDRLIRVDFDEPIPHDMGGQPVSTRWNVARWEKAPDEAVEKDPYQVKYERLVDLIVAEATARSWGSHLSAVFENAGVPLPRVKVQAKVKATRPIHGYQSYLHPWWAQATEGQSEVDQITLHRTLSIELTVPDDLAPGCHCDERSDDGRLPTWAAEQIVAKAREILPAGSGWRAEHRDATLSCAWCA